MGWAVEYLFMILRSMHECFLGPPKASDQLTLLPPAWYDHFGDEDLSVS